MAAGLGVAAALLAVGCGSPSEIVIVVGAEPGLAVDHLRIVAESAGRNARVEHAPRAPGAAAAPWTLGVSGRAGEELAVRVTATTGGGVIEASARARFVAGDRRVLYVYLAAACLDVACPERMTCDFASGACVDDERPTCELPPAFPQGPPPACVEPPPDGGAPDGQVDAGQDGGGIPLPRPSRCESGICAVSAGARHACALRSTGEVLCWGGNDHGEQGDPAGARGHAARVDGVSAALEVAAGGGFTCALTEIDRVVCWGDNRRSQLGSAPEPSSPFPISVGIPTSAPPVAIRAGDAFACSLHADHTVFCWGDNSRGQLAIPLLTDRSAPMRVELPFAAEGLTAGAAHACAWGEGRLFCWGSNERQQINGTSSASTAAEVSIPGARIESAAAGRGHTCAIVGQDLGASVYCWGDNERGQSGGVGRIAPIPQVVPVVEPRALAAGGAHTCALVEGGERVCWGHNAGGALAVLGSGEVVPAPSAGNDAGPWRQLSAGDDYTCGVGDDGVGRCWGWDLAGAAGRGATLSSRAPAPATGGTTIRSVALGAAHTCATVDDVLRCWGGNALRQLGTGGSAPASTPADVFPTANFVAAGASHTCFITVDNQALRCVGANHSGQSAQPTTTPIVALPPTDPLLGMVASVTAGAEHTCVSQSETGVLCWGRGDLGQLGVGVRDMPTPAPELIVGSLSSPSAGAAHTCAIGADSYAECWGANDRGQLGRPVSPLETSLGRAFPAQVDGVVSGGRFTCGWNRIAGRVWCVGADDAGQLGDGEPLEDKAIPVEIVAPGVEGVAVGARHACWWSSTAVSCWGANERGQAGPATEPRLASPTLVPMDEAMQILAVAAGEAHTCAAIATGAIPPQQVVCWGSDEDGRLGTGRALVFNAPESVVGL